MEGQGEVMRLGEENTSNVGGRIRMRDEEHESRSGSDNMEGASGDDQEGDETRPPRKKRYHRHTPQQIQELEQYKFMIFFICEYTNLDALDSCYMGFCFWFRLFKECPHPDEKQRLELSRRLSLETRQVKFWFQNRRTQMKVMSRITGLF